MEVKHELSNEMCASTPEEVAYMKKVSYASAVGSIMYAVRCTRPDVTFGQNLVSRYQQNPGKLHWVAVKHILKYLRNTRDMFLVYGGKPDTKLSSASDSKFTNLPSRMRGVRMRADEARGVSTLSACVALRDLELGKDIHSYVRDEISFTMIIGNALLDMYCKCGCLEVAREIFDGLPKKNVICWTSMVSGYLSCGCAQVGVLEQGNWIHEYMNEHRIVIDAVCNTALIDMCAKCGCIDKFLERILKKIKVGLRRGRAWPCERATLRSNSWSFLSIFSNIERKGPCSLFAPQPICAGTTVPLNQKRHNLLMASPPMSEIMEMFKSEEDKELVKDSYNAYELWDLAENALNDLNEALAKYIKNPASTNNPDIDEIKKFYDKVEATREQAAEIQTSVISFLHSKRYSYSSFIRDEPEAMEA
ncbi:retrotransposon protein, putative, ty1-copia subclass [Tanacetum coccineum]